MKKYISVEKNIDGTYSVNTNETPGGNVEANKEATIDVSTYTEPVEIEPTQGKDSMAKATVTLSNIPSGGSVTVYAWNLKNIGANAFAYTNFLTAPATQEDFEGTKELYPDYQHITFQDFSYSGSYTRISDTEFKFEGMGTIVYERSPSNDFTIWG